VIIGKKPGVGKTALAIEAAHRLRASFPNGQLYLNLQTAEDDREVFGSLLSALGIRERDIPDSLSERIDWYEAILANRRVLILLDDVDEVTSLVQQLLRLGPGCMALITTSSIRLPDLYAYADDPEEVVLDVLRPDLAAELLKRLVKHDRVQAEPQAAAEVTRLCDYLPLSLHIAAARLNAQPARSLHNLAEQLTRSHLSVLKTGDPEVPGSVALAYEELADEERKAFRLLSLLASNDVRPWALAALLDCEIAHAESLIGKLISAKLLEEVVVMEAGEIRYRLHDLLLRFARARVEDEEAPATRRAATERAIGSYLTLVKHAGTRLQPRQRQIGETDPSWWPPGSGEHVKAAVLEAPLKWFTFERPGLIASVRQAHQTELWDLTWQLAVGLNVLFELGSYWNDWRFTHEKFALSASEHSGDSSAPAEVLFSLGALCREEALWVDAKAYFDRSMKIFERIGHRSGQAWVLRNLGLVFREQGRWSDAETYFEKSLTFFEDLEDQRGRARTLGSLGRLLSDQGRWPEAASRLNDSLAIFRDIGDRAGEAHAMASLGEWHRQQGQWDGAARYFAECLPILQREEDRRTEALVRLRMGKLCSKQSRWSEAIVHLDEALDVFTELDDRFGQARAQRERAVIKRHQGDWSEAVDCLGESLAMLRELRDRRGQAYTWLAWSHLYIDQERWDEAASLCNEGLETFRDLGDRRGEARCIISLARALEAQGKTAEAIQQLTATLPKLDAFGDRMSKAQAFSYLGNAYRKQERWREAIDCYLQSRAIFSELGHLAGEAHVLTNLGRTYRDQGKRADAQACLEQSLRMFQEVGSRLWEGKTLHALATVVEDPKDRDNKRRRALTILSRLGVLDPD